MILLLIIINFQQQRKNKMKNKNRNSSDRDAFERVYTYRLWSAVVNRWVKTAQLFADPEDYNWSSLDELICGNGE